MGMCAEALEFLEAVARDSMLCCMLCVCECVCVQNRVHLAD